LEEFQGGKKEGRKLWLTRPKLFLFQLYENHPSALALFNLGGLPFFFFVFVFEKQVAYPLYQLFHSFLPKIPKVVKPYNKKIIRYIGQ